MKPNDKISPHFTLAELIRTRTRLPNLPQNEQILNNLRYLAKTILEPIRSAFGPYTPSSTYRSPEVNRAVGGTLNSQHPKGQAADIDHPRISPEALMTWVVENLEFDQAILEGGWVHVSVVDPKLGKPNRKQPLQKIGKRYLPWRKKPQ